MKIHTPINVLRLGILNFLLCIFVCTFSTVSQATVVEVRGRQLFVDGTLFTVKGVAYSPTPIGSRVPYYNWWDDPKAYKDDFPRIASIGANIIRTFDATKATKDALDFAYKNKLYVIMGYYVDTSVDLSSPSVRQSIYNNFLTMVSSWTAHPAILAWALGNEQNLHNGNNSAWYTLVDSCAYTAHRTEGKNFHPVMTVEGGYLGNIGNPNKKADDISMPNLDIWGNNLYLGPTFQNAFNDYKLKSAKPFLITEFGWDAYDESTGAENQTIQATNLTSQWTHISINLGAIDPQNVCAGGIVFAWTDEWWKSFLNSLGDAGHDTTNDWTNPSYPAQIIQEEWWGIVSISSGIYGKRKHRQACLTLHNLWDNLLLNPGFEANSTGWVITNPGITTIDSVTFHSGAKSAKISTPFINSGLIYNDPGVIIKAGNEYQLSAWVKLDNVITNSTGNGVSVLAAVFNSAGSLLGWGSLTPVLTGTKNWTFYSASFIAPPMSHKVHIIPSFSNAAGNAWFDDMKIINQPPYTIFASQELTSINSAQLAIRSSESFPHDIPLLTAKLSKEINQDFDNLKVYPNPYEPGSNSDFDATGITFENLPNMSKISIHNLLGEKIIELRENDNDGILLWDGKNYNGSQTASGIYLYRVTTPQGNSRQGRLAIIR